MNEADRELLARALSFATAAHAGQTRKGSDVPYVSHVISVAGLVLGFGGTAELGAVALVHDTVEDCEDVTLEILRREFGPGVADRVALLTDLLEGDTPGRKGRWIDRKRLYLEQARGADLGTRQVAACDKLDNLRGLLLDLDVEGEPVWERFTGSPSQTRWYFESVRRAVGEDLPRGLVLELDRHLVRLAHLVPEASPGTDD